MGRATLMAIACAIALHLAPESRAASIGVDPSVKFLSCGSPACDSVAVQVSLQLLETGADGFEFTLDVTNAGLLGWTPGTSVGAGVAGMTGGVVLQADGTTLIGSFTSVSSPFDGPQTFDVALLDLQATGIGTSELRFLDAEISCSSCAGGSGTIYPNGNVANQLIGTINVVPEPDTLALTVLGLLALGARRPR